MSSNFEPICQKSVTRVQRTVFWLQRSWTSTLHTENSNVFRLYALIWLPRIQHFNAIRWLIVKIFKTWLCHWFLKYSKNLCWTAQNHHEEWILAAEIVDIYPSPEKTVVLSSFLASMKTTISSISDAKKLIFRISQNSFIRLVPWKLLIDQRKNSKTGAFWLQRSWTSTSTFKNNSFRPSFGSVARRIFLIIRPQFPDFSHL